MSTASSSFHSDRVRMEILMKRKEGMSREEFDRYWIEVHGPLFVELDIVKKNILKFEQGLIATSSSAQLFADAMQVPDSGYDGVALFEAETFEKLQEVFTNEEYQRIITPDGENLYERSACKIILQQLNTAIDK